MSRKRIVAANWKMNKGLAEAKNLVASIVAADIKDTDVVRIIFPPALFISELNALLHEHTHYRIGAQNCYHTESGAYTGEISALQIASVGATYVLVGHSERRQYFHEEGDQLKQKINLVLKNQLKPIYCVGEKLQERQNNQYFTAVKKQLQESLFHLNVNEVKNTSIAYEPVWAIGTGLTASPDQAQEMHGFIRLALAEQYGSELSQEISILYGGSCNAKNAQELFACPDVDGGLIGGASLVAEDFLKIVNAF